MAIHEKICFASTGAPAAFAMSIRETGFAVLENHAIPSNLITATYDEWARFFASPDKDEYRYDPVDYSGYYPYRSENAKDQQVMDLKEFFHVYEWSPLPTGLSDATRTVFGALVDLASTLLAWIEDATPEHVRRGFSMPLSAMITNKCSEG